MHSFEKIKSFISKITRMTAEGEPGSDGQPFEPVSEDAIATLNEIMQEARQLRPLISQLDLLLKREQAVRQFVDCWNLSMPYHEIGPALTCIECNALHRLLLVYGAPEVARALLEAHVAGDEEDDDPVHFKIRASLELHGP